MQYTPELHIDLKAVQENYARLSARAKNAACGAVVKANAYGLGVRHVAQALMEAGAEEFFVATLDEGLALRKMLPHVPIYLFNGLHDVKEVAHARLIPVLNTRAEIMYYAQFCRMQQRKLPAAVHVDTGMNRLGMSLQDASKIDKADLKAIDVRVVMSHLASAENPKHKMNKEQLKKFNAARKLFPAARASLANSAGIFLDRCYHFDLARPGCALYGINPTLGKNPVKHVVTLRAPILMLRTVTEPGTVGYGGTAKVKKGARIATVPAGYADGILRQLSNKGEAVVAGKKVPYLGRVSMDLITLDVSEIPEKMLENAPYAELLGPDYDVNAMARDAGTIGYEILTRLGSRFHRIYSL